MADDETSPLFPSIPPPRRTTESWVCSKCGNDVQDRVRADATKPSLDDRYGLGSCDDCSPARKGPKGLARATVQLVRADVWRRETWLQVQLAKSNDKLLARFRRGDKLDNAEVDQVRHLIRLQETGRKR